MAVSYVDSTSVYATWNPSNPIDVPVSGISGLQDDDQLIAFCLHRWGSSDLSAPAGWTAIESNLNGQNGGWRISIFRKTASSESGNWTFTADEGSGTSSGLILVSAFRGIDLASPLDISYVRADHNLGTSSDLSPASPDITTVTDGCMILQLLGVNKGGSSTTITVPSSYNSAIEYEPGTNFGLNAAIAYREQTSAGLENAADWTLTSTNQHAETFVLALRPAPDAAITGTATEGILESDIVAGGKTIIITLNNGDTWVASGATFDAQRQNIIDGLDAATSPTNGWNNEVRDKEVVSAVERTSDAVVTITLSAASGYSAAAPPSSETITVTVPASAISGASPIVGEPTFTVTANNYSASAVYDGLTILPSSVLMLFGGDVTDDHDGPDNSSNLIHAAVSPNFGGTDTLVGEIARNTSDNSSGPITANTTTQITATLSGGTDNDWDTGDKYEVVVGQNDAPPATSDLIYHEPQVTVSSESFSLDWYWYDVSADTYSQAYTLNGTATGATDGTYSVDMDDKGRISLSLQLTSNGGSGDSKLQFSMGQSKSWLLSAGPRSK